MRSAPTLKIWMTPAASVAMLEKLGLLKIAVCSAPIVSSVSAWRTSWLRRSSPVFFLAVRMASLCHQAGSDAIDAVGQRTGETARQLDAGQRRSAMLESGRVGQYVS